MGSVDWSGETYPVHLGSSGYLLYLPVLSVDETTDVYAAITMGLGTKGEIDRQQVIRVFERMYLDRCVADSYAKIFNKVDVSFVDDEL